MAPDAPASTLAPGVQTVVSFLLFVHLFALAVGITSNESPSELETALRNRTGVRAYLEPTMMDLSYAFTFTYGPTTGPGGDTQAWVEVELNLPDGTKRTEIIPGTFPYLRQRARRYESLARRAVTMIGNPTFESMIPAAIVNRLVAETGATGGTVRCGWRQLPVVPFQPTGEQEHTTYQARILVSDGAVELFKIESASESAPTAEKKADQKIEGATP
ncbi:MAG TPA: hypothetical protein VG713_15520 [Pirellulales bacterium]|nr:hypothetical protein [Pirellulales bacterium]